jgi:hypothetical protein
VPGWRSRSARINVSGNWSGSRAFQKMSTAARIGKGGRTSARRVLRVVSPEEETLVRNLADAPVSFPSIEAVLNPLMERIRNRLREALLPGPIRRSNSTNLVRRNSRGNAAKHRRNQKSSGHLSVRRVKQGVDPRP